MPLLLLGVEGEVGDIGEEADISDGEDGNAGEEGVASGDISPSSSPLNGDSVGEEVPDTLCEIIFLASSESGSTRSGGSLSFSISDLRLWKMNYTNNDLVRENIRVIKSSDSFLNSFCTKSQSTIWKLSRPRNILEF